MSKKGPFSKAVRDTKALEDACNPMGMSFSEFLYGASLIEDVALGKSLFIDDFCYAPFQAMLYKAAKPHKYIMRIPNKTPPPKYRYVYNIHRKGKYVGDDEHFKQGAKLKVKHDDGHAHLEVVESKDGKIKVRHSVTGKEEEHDAQSLTEKIRGDYTTQISEHKSKLARDLAAVHKYGTLSMQRRLVERAAQFGVFYRDQFEEEEEEKVWVREGEKKERGDPDPDREIKKREFKGRRKFGNWKPPERAATTLHEKAMPKVTIDLPEDVLNFPNPEGFKKMLFRHQAEAIQRILDSWKKRDGFLLQDETGLGKTLTAIATLIANGGKRNLIVVPENGKKALIQQLREDAALYGIDIKDALGSGPDDEGIFVISYDQMYNTEVVLDPETGKPVKDSNFKDGIRKRHILKDEFKNGFDATVFDECQNMQNPAGVRSQACIELQGNSDKVLYMSATPFTNVSDMHYLRKMGMFKDGAEFVDWAEKVGARKTKETPPGDLPVGIGNPSSPIPLVAASAFMHHHGMTIRRSPDMQESLKSNFAVVKSEGLSADHKKAFDVASQIHTLALDAGMSAFTAGGLMSMWRKQQWECAKVGQGIENAKKALDEGRSVGLFFSFKEFDHQPLRAFARMLKSKSGIKEHGLDAKQAKAASAKIEALIASMPKFDPIGEAREALSKHMGGTDKIAEIHGGAKGDAKSEQKAFQNNEKHVMIGTIAKAGTGLSFHDTKTKEQGGRPRTQINMSLPYTATEFQQLNGRMHRLGSKSDTEMMYMLGDHDSEKEIGSIVAGKLESMGAAIAGDTGNIASASQLANWEFSRRSGSDDEIVDGIESTVTGNEPKNANSQLSKQTFERFLDSMQAGQDIFAESGAAIGAAKEAKQDSKHRKAAAKLQAAGYHIDRVGDQWMVRNVSTAKGTAEGRMVTAVNSMKTQKHPDVYKKGPNAGKPHPKAGQKKNYDDSVHPESPLDHVKAGTGKKDIVIRHPMGITYLANILAKEGAIPDGDHGSVDSWDQKSLDGHKSRSGERTSKAPEKKKKKKVSKSSPFVTALQGALSDSDRIDGILEDIRKNW